MQTQQEHLFPTLSPCDVIHFRPSTALQKNSKPNQGFLFLAGCEHKNDDEAGKESRKSYCKNLTKREAEKSNKAR